MQFIRYLLLLTLFLINAQSMRAAQGELRILLSLADDALVVVKIQEAFMQPFILAACTFESDVAFSVSEFNYLVDMRKGDQIDAAQIAQAVSYLDKKNKFEHIELVLKDGEQGKHLHWVLTGLWTFARLNISGVLVGKDAYRYFYMLERGDPFEQQKHQLSLRKIKEALMQEGYFNAQLQDVVVRNTKDKSVTVNVTLNRGERFVMNNVQIDWLEVENLPVDDLVKLQHKVKKHFINKLSNKYYQQKLINKETKALRKLLGHEGFLDVALELEKRVDHLKNKITLIFSVNLNKKKRMVFIGNQFFCQAQLVDAIVVFGRSAALLPTSILCQELAHLYHTKGFWRVNLQATQEADRFVFMVNEGDRVSIDTIVLKGASSFNAALLVEQFFKLFLKKNFYDESLIKQGIAKLLDYYRQQGFLEVKLLQQKYLPTSLDDQYILELVLDEGQRTYLGRVTIGDFPELLQQGPFVHCNSASVPIPFDPEVLVEHKKFLQRIMIKQGYTSATIKHELTREGNRAHIAWKIDYEGTHKVTFGKTVVVGNFRLPFEYIKRELQYEEDEPWDAQKLKQSLVRLRALDLFEHIHLYPYQPALFEPKKTVLLKVYDDDPFEVRLRTGFGLQQVSKHYVFGRGVTFGAGLSLVGKSPLNIGDQVKFDADFTRAYRKVNGCYMVPWLFGLPVRTLFKAYSNKYYQPTFLESSKNLYDVTQEGFLISFARKYHFYDGAISFGIEWLETDLKNADPELCQLASQLAQAINFTPQLADKKVPYFQFEPTLFIDHLDDRLNPTYGSLTLFAFKGMVPLEHRFSNAYLFKVLIEQSLFFPFGKDFVGAMRLRGGHIFSAHFSNVMPIERFYLGGAHSIRSYDVDLCPPVGLFNDAMGRAQIVPQGGQTMANANFELRFPLFKGLSGVLFQDIGTLVGGAHQQSFDDQVLLAGTGFGLRYNTPIGPIRFDIAFKWKKRDTMESSYAWFLSLGQAF